MKKILAFLLALMLLLPAVSLGEAAEVVDTYPVEFDDFTLQVTSYDIIQKAPTKADNQLLFLLYPNYDETATVFNNINAIWTSQDMLPELPQLDVNAFGQDIVTESVAAMNAAGIIATNAQLLSAEKDDSGVVMLLFTMDADYTPAGVELQATLYQAQYYVCLGAKGTYCFTLTAYTPDDLTAMLSYVESIEFKE